MSSFERGLSRSLNVLGPGVRLATVNGVAVGGVKGSLDTRLDENVGHTIALDAYV